MQERMETVCGEELKRFRAAQKDLETKLRTLDEDAEYASASRTAYRSTKEASRQFQTTVERLEDAAEEVMYRGDLDEKGKRDRIRRMGEKAQKELEDLATTFPAALRAMQLHQLAGSMLGRGDGGTTTMPVHRLL
jgi:aspartate aminotransferase-like enzyme